MKVCKRCGEEKVASCFSPDSRAAGGLHHSCKQCRNGFAKDLNAVKKHSKEMGTRLTIEATAPLMRQVAELKAEVSVLRGRVNVLGEENFVLAESKRHIQNRLDRCEGATNGGAKEQEVGW